MTQRGLGAKALTIALVLLSFLLLRTACWADLHVSHNDEHPHAVKSLITTHGPADQCHHHDDRSAHTDLLDQALPRQHDRSGHPAATQSPPSSVASETPVRQGHHVSPPQGSGGPPRPGRALLIVLGVARN